jgi:hypothetical protein
VVLPGAVLPAGGSGSAPDRVLGAVPSSQFYVRCRLVRGRPDAPPRLVGVFADAVLVEQRGQAGTALLAPTSDRSARLALRDLNLPEETADNVSDAANDLAARGWGSEVAAWGYWPASLRPLGQLLGEAPAVARGYRTQAQCSGEGGPEHVPSPALRTHVPASPVPSVPFVILNVGNGEAGQSYKLPCPPAWPDEDAPSPNDPDDPPPPTVIADSLHVWTVEPNWGWDPRLPLPPGPLWREVRWLCVPNLVLCHRTTQGYRFGTSADASLTPDEQLALATANNAIVFGDGESGRVPPPGSVVAAAYDWTMAEAGNVAAGQTWGRVDDPSAPPPGDATKHPGKPVPPPAIPFGNPLPAAGGKPAEDLPSAMSRLAAEFGATDALLGRADRVGATTLDGINLAGQIPPPMAVTLLDFECLARTVPGTVVVRARAWAEVDARRPDLAVPGAVTVVIVPALPADRPEPTPGLLRRVAAHLEARRPVVCRVCVTGPQYQPVGVRATVHTTPGNGPAVRDRAVKRVKQLLDPLHGGPGGTGWPFGRAVHPGELLRVLAAVEGVAFVTDLQLSADDGAWAEAPVALAALALAAAAEPQIDVREDA